jgi:hypothetical protein
LKRVLLNGVSLERMLQNAVADGWKPAETNDQREERADCRLLPDQRAAEIWENERAGLKRFYLDMLLGLLAKRAKKE